MMPFNPKLKSTSVNLSEYSIHKSDHALADATLVLIHQCIN